MPCSAAVPALGTDLWDLVRVEEAEEGPTPYIAVAGQWLSFVRATGWQPGILTEDAQDIFSFWSVRGRMVGQARVSQVLAGYYLSVLQGRFRCRVGLHISCMPARRRGDASFVRLSMARWRWAPC
jgi:hypothetical protein